jgi:hypothetical protein
MPIRDVLAGKFLSLLSAVSASQGPCTDLHNSDRTMARAVDLDDGTLIDSLVKTTGRPEQPKLPKASKRTDCFAGGECVICHQKLEL